MDEVIVGKYSETFINGMTEIHKNFIKNIGVGVRYNANLKIGFDELFNIINELQWE